MHAARLRSFASLSLSACRAFTTARMSEVAKTPKEVLDFWFTDEMQKSGAWWFENPELDAKIRQRFTHLYEEAVNGRLTAEWMQTPQGACALIIILDQFTRNMFRGDPKTYSGDALALQCAREAVKKGLDQKLDVIQRGFLYLPYEHSEDREAHEDLVKLLSKPGMEVFLNAELDHKKTIDRFGRYPHRNLILGRESTAEELEYIKNNDGYT